MKKEFGKWLMDIAKYITTAVLLSAVFSNLSMWPWYFYVATVVGVLLLLLVGLKLVDGKEKSTPTKNTHRKKKH